jgi:hypothetical protein
MTASCRGLLLPPPISDYWPCAMPISITAFASCLLILSAARAQIYAPNCSVGSSLTWVGYLRTLIFLIHNKAVYRILLVISFLI